MDPLDFHNLDAVFHSRIRLAVVSALIKGGKLDFNELRDVTGATAGNLATHVRKLEDAEYVSVEKGFHGRRLRTTYALTERGRKAFGNYVENLASFIGTPAGDSEEDYGGENRKEKD